MENILDLTVVLPIKSSLAKDFSELFNNAVTSVKNQKLKVKELLIVATQEEHLQDFLRSYDFSELNHRILTWEGEPNFSNQINFGIENANTEWVSIFEFDDEYASIWFDNFNKYKNYYNDVDVFLPVVVDTNEKGVFAGFTNEAVFAANFAQEMGYLTNDILQDYQNFQTSGMVFRKKVFSDFGGFKPSIKLTFVYELFLRWTYNSVKIMSIPRIGYKHSNMREGSLFWNYKNGDDRMVDDEVKFWVQTAKKEYFFPEDRSIKYVSSND
jgi:hypothetical protein